MKYNQCDFNLHLGKALKNTSFTQNAYLKQLLQPSSRPMDDPVLLRQMKPYCNGYRKPNRLTIKPIIGSKSDVFQGIQFETILVLIFLEL